MKSRPLKAGPGAVQVKKYAADLFFRGYAAVNDAPSTNPFPSPSRIASEGGWTLFLDRDGVVNVRLVDEYVRTWDEFRFVERVPEAIAVFSRVFSRIFIVTNQQGIGKGLMSEYDLGLVHGRMLAAIEAAGGRVDRIYYCPHLKSDGCSCRKPLPGMAKRALEDFPDVDLSRSLMAGDSSSDMAFADNAGMHKVMIGDRSLSGNYCGPHYATLFDFAGEFAG